MRVPYYVRDIFTRNEYKKFNEPIKVTFINRYSILADFQRFLNHNYVIDDTNFDLIIYLNYNNHLKNDGYHLSILNKEAAIYIDAYNERGIRYAFNLLMTITENRNNTIYLPIIKISDEASFNMRGIIEGFYGEPWSHEARLDVIKTMDRYRLNTFMYAPKDDLYHRDKWRELYPEFDLNKLLTYKNDCDNYDIDFYYCISPGKDFNYTKEAEFALLFEKLNQLIYHGVNKFALLLDDIDYKLSGDNLKQFKKPGLAHSYIANKLNQYLKSVCFKYDLVLCPTEYFQNFDTIYRNELKEHLDLNIKVFWTGYNTVAEVITENDGKIVKESFGHELILWDNYPVNDFSKNRLFLGPLVNRSTRLGETHFGMLSNPMNQWYASKIAVITMAHYMWNSERYDANKSYELALSETVSEEFVDSLRTFANLNTNCVLTKANQSEYEELIESNDFELINEFYIQIEECVTHLRQCDNNELLIDFEHWFIRCEKEWVLWKKIYKKEEVSIEILQETFAYPYQIGVNVLLEYLIKNKKYEEANLIQYIKKPRINFWSV